MATICRICHPEQFNEQDPDPQHIHVDDSEHSSETSDSDDGSDSSSDNSPEEVGPGNAKVSGNDRNDDTVCDSDKADKQFDNADVGEDSGDATTTHGVCKREIRRSYKSKKARRHKRGGRNKPRRRNNEDSPLVKMPSGKSYHIRNIVEPHWKCGQKTKLIPLGPNSKRGKRQFDIVDSEMQNSILPNDNCESTGGCFERYNIVKIEKIVQGCAWRRYQARKTDVALESGFANEKMLFHGTDAVWNVVSGGFDERFTSSNGQFGAGLYFAKHSSVANQFVFGYFGGNGCKLHHDKNCYICDRHLLLCRVTLGKPYQLKSIENLSHPPPGYHSVEALVGKAAFQAPEFVVYRGEQAYPEYLITYKIVKPKEDKHEDRDNKWGDQNRNKNDGNSGHGNGNRNKNDGNSGHGNGNRNKNDGNSGHGKHKDDDVRTPSRHDVEHQGFDGRGPGNINSWRNADGGRRTDRRGYGNSYRN